MKRKVVLLISLFIIVTFVLYTGCSDKSMPSTSKEDVIITNNGTHYEVVLDFANGKSHREIGENMAVKILQLVPEYESLIDSYLKEAINVNYETIINRVNNIKPQIDKEYIDEIEGMASKFSGSNQNILGDGKISIDELYIWNLFPDVVRSTQCSALSVYGERSITKHTITARNLEFPPGLQDQLAKIHTVTTFRNSDKSICTVGYLGYIGVVSGFNDDKVFAAILDSGTGRGYSSESRRSYPLDIRYALENYSTLDEIGDYLKSSERNYSYSHLVILSDSNISKVLENNISSGVNSIRDLRTEQSKLNKEIQWGIDNSIGCVNSFLLKGNYDNHSIYLGNTARWDCMRKELTSKGEQVTLEELKEIACFFTGNTPGYQIYGDLYILETQQIILFEPSNFNLEIYFRPKNGVLVNTPSFEKVVVKFQ